MHGTRESEGSAPYTPEELGAVRRMELPMSSARAFATIDALQGTIDSMLTELVEMKRAQGADLPIGEVKPPGRLPSGSSSGPSRFKD